MSAISILKEMHVNNIEELITCPLCFEMFSMSVPCCSQGHSICVKCVEKLDYCPYCKSQFNGSRNYIAEQLITKFHDIKISILSQNDSVNENKHQTSIVETENEESKKSVPKVIPSNGKGKYPCKLDDCEEQFPLGRMLEHIRYYHLHNLKEVKIESNTEYTTSWKFMYSKPMCFGKALSISNMGLFFVILKIDIEGNLIGNLQIVNNIINAQLFRYKLDVHNTHRHHTYEGEVISCRSIKCNKYENSLYVRSLAMEDILTKLKFCCKLTISYK